MRRVLIADDIAPVRRVLRRLIDSQTDLAVVGEAADTAELLALARADRPDVIVTDLRMGGDTMAAIRDICDGLRSRVVVYTAHGDDANRVRAQEAGAAAVVVKGSPGADLLDAVRRAALR